MFGLFWMEMDFKSTFFGIDCIVYLLRSSLQDTLGINYSSSS